MATAIISAGGNNIGSGDLDPSDFSTNIDNPLFPLANLETKIFEGTEADPDTGETIDTRLESTVLEKTRKVAGVRVLVLEEKAYEDDELIERALDYFAQASDGTVWYFGEDVDNYVDGKIDNHDGSWLAGKHGAEQGIIMPAVPFVGQAYNQEFAPGIAEDKARVLFLNESVSTPAGNFTGCLKTEDTNPLDTPVLIEYKFYCPDMGVVREEAPDGFIELTSYTAAEGADDISASEAIGNGGDPGAQPAVPVDANQDAVADADDDDQDPAAASVLSQASNSVVAVEDEDGAEDVDTGKDAEEADEQTGAAGQIDDGAELLPQAAITLEQAVAAAQAAASGAVGEVDLEHFQGKLVFNIDIGDKDVKVDAETGAVLSEDSDD